MKRTRISGSIFHSRYTYKGKTRISRKWTIQYHGIRESTHLTEYDDAYALLLTRLKEHADGERSSRPDRVRMNQLFNLLIEDHRLQERDSLYDVTKRVDAHLRPFWDKIKAQDVGTDLRNAYVAQRQKQNVANSTINKELCWVRRAMKLGERHDPPLVRRVPHFPMLPVNNARQGVVSEDCYHALMHKGDLPEHVRIALLIGFHTGSRRGEITSIEKTWVDLEARVIPLPGKFTKNGGAPGVADQRRNASGD